MNQLKYVVASTDDEAWYRFRAKLYADTRAEAVETQEILTMNDSCTHKCTYSIYEARVTFTKLEDDD